LLWVPLAPVSGGSPGNEDGNPHIDVAQVLSIWRDSVPRDIADKWRNIDASPAAAS
jgi:hypothetical protein